MCECGQVAVLINLGVFETKGKNHILVLSAGEQWFYINFCPCCGSEVEEGKTLEEIKTKYFEREEVRGD